MKTMLLLFLIFTKFSIILVIQPKFRYTIFQSHNHILKFHSLFFVYRWWSWVESCLRLWYEFWLCKNRRRVHNVTRLERKEQQEIYSFSWIKIFNQYTLYKRACELPALLLVSREREREHLACLQKDNLL